MMKLSQGKGIAGGSFLYVFLLLDKCEEQDYNVEHKFE